MVASLLVISIIVPSTLLSYPQKAQAITSECVAQMSGALAASKATGALTRVPAFVGSLVELSVSGSFITDCVLMPLAVQLAKAMLYNITVSTVNWINSGFQGNPGFVQDFEGLLTDTADQVIGDFIAKDLGAGFLCSPFSFQVKIALAQSYLPYKKKSACTFTQIAGSVDGFAEGNNSGGWDNWLQVTTVPQNNKYGAFAIAQDELSRKIFDAQATKEKYLDWGNGFKDWEVCEVPAYQPGYDDPNAVRKPVCEKRTPGAVIQDRLSATLNIDLQQLAVANNINAIMDALANQVTKQIVTGAQGLLGSKNKGGGYGSVSYSSALTNAGAGDPELTAAIDTSLASSANAFDPYTVPDPQPVVTTDSGSGSLAESEARITVANNPGTVNPATPFLFGIQLGTGTGISSAYVEFTLMKSGSPTTLSSLFSNLDVSGSAGGGWQTQQPSLGNPNFMWKIAATSAENPYSLRVRGPKAATATAGTYVMKVVATDGATGEIVAEHEETFTVQ